MVLENPVDTVHDVLPPAPHNEPPPQTPIHQPCNHLPARRSSMKKGLNKAPLWRLMETRYNRAAGLRSYLAPADVFAVPLIFHQSPDFGEEFGNTGAGLHVCSAPISLIPPLTPLWSLLFPIIYMPSIH